MEWFLQKPAHVFTETCGLAWCCCDLWRKENQQNDAQNKKANNQTKTIPSRYLACWPSLLPAWDEGPVAEGSATGFEEGRTAVAPWAAVEVVVEAEEEEEAGILRVDSWAAPSLRFADIAPSASPRGGASVCAAGSCRNSRAWRWQPRPTRSQRNRPGRCRCPATSPWQWRGGQEEVISDGQDGTYVRYCYPLELASLWLVSSGSMSLILAHLSHLVIKMLAIKTLTLLSRVL